ncbi:NXPE family member 4-like isoform X2 [Anneissia japonica]|uniref:NXPE family member 4-like isoform X1 n=1 Tax=Anneissia japonica TaxID=1529436 RepID=UPI00142560DF|nr:NXPE family member 4-like isoform X1 [Anneissia japonica]XP_033104544.1 NXPE family member 4-like isoform X2 [Anneissia japonica]
MISSRQIFTVIGLPMTVAVVYLMSISTVERSSRIYPNAQQYRYDFNDSRSTFTINIPSYKSILSQIPVAEPVFNTKGIGSMGFTDSSRSTFHLKYNDSDINVGEFFSVVIESRDKNGRHRVLGGDFWYATIKIGYCSEAGKILDFQNGTYEVVFFAACPGNVKLTIILVHTVETVHFYKHTVWSMEERKLWNATYKVGNKEEYGLCRIHNVGIWKDKCEFPHPKAMGGSLMLCDPPRTLPCSSLYGLRSKGETQEILANAYTSFLTDHEDLFRRKINFGYLTNGTDTFTIQRAGEESMNVHKTLMNYIKRPECTPDTPEPINDGFWYRNTWHSFACRSRSWSRKQIRTCINNKRLIFLGDSTTRQWCEKLLLHLDVDVPEDLSRKGYDIVTDFLNLTFQFHPYVLGNGIEKVSEGKFEVDVLDSLATDNCHYVIMISPWAHYEVWTKEAYLSRLEHIKAGIISFRQKCPDTKFVIKSPHPRRHSSKSLQTFIIARLTSDVLLYEIRNLMHDTFKGMGIHFIDIWDMNLAYDSPNTIHMPLEVAIQELFMYFSHICPDITNQ